MGINSRELKAALEAARKAGVVALKGFRGGFKVEYKSDSSPVTAWDRASEEIIRRTLSRAFPGDGFIGEEYGENRGTTGASWVIDPIDGTKNFVRGIPFWGSLIARIEGGRLTLGVMHLPASGETLWAVRGGGAFHNGKRIRVSRINRLGKSFITHGGLEYFVRDGDAPRLERLASASYIARSFGDCGAYAYVARGMTDAMLERGLKPWDAAAPKIIVEEAGGKFTDWSGRDNWRSPEVLATNGHVHSAILKLIRR
jgi:histidinol-phosphatase